MERWRVWRAMAIAVAPTAAAEVANPARGEWPYRCRLAMLP